MNQGLYHGQSNTPSLSSNDWPSGSHVYHETYLISPYASNRNSPEFMSNNYVASEGFSISLPISQLAKVDSREYPPNLEEFEDIGGSWGAPDAEETGNVEDTGETKDTNHTESQGSSKPKRKRENRYKNAPPAVISRRREQNRASQRAYRERKDQRIKDLEVDLQKERDKLARLDKGFTDVVRVYEELKRNYEQVVRERDELQKAKGQFWMSSGDAADAWVAAGAYNSNNLTPSTLGDVSTGYSDHNYGGHHFFDDHHADYPG